VSVPRRAHGAAAIAAAPRNRTDRHRTSPRTPKNAPPSAPATSPTPSRSQRQSYPKPT